MSPSRHQTWAVIEVRPSSRQLIWLLVVCVVEFLIVEFLRSSVWTLGYIWLFNIVLVHPDYGVKFIFIKCQPIKFFLLCVVVSPIFCQLLAIYALITYCFSINSCHIFTSHCSSIFATDRSRFSTQSQNQYSNSVQNWLSILHFVKNHKLDHCEPEPDWTRTRTLGSVQRFEVQTEIQDWTSAALVKCFCCVQRQINLTVSLTHWIYTTSLPFSSLSGSTYLHTPSKMWTDRKL